MASEQPCTLAVDMFGPITLKDDSQLILLDCCGLGLRSFDVEARLLSLLSLISSRMILNQVGGISDGAFEHLSFVQTMPALVKGRRLQKLMPALSFVLRDFSSQFKTMDAQAYMEHSLERESTISEEDVALNLIRQSLKELFVMDCYQLPKPQESNF